MLIYAVTIFLSSILLFQVQPIIAKAILPWFGGAAGVWTICMLFFQVVLLLGYIYAHWISRFRSRWQLLSHAVVLAGSLLLLPVFPDPRWRPMPGGSPLVGIGLLLLTSVAVPYFVLSTTSPLCQAWFATVNKAGLPYRLFAISNAASLIGLLGYPLAIEPFVRTHTQLFSWSIAYAAFAATGIVAMALTWVRLPNTRREPHEPEEPVGVGIGLATWTLWIALPACGSALLLSVTNYLCQDVAPVPFLWVVPLVCYLATFVLCFASESWYRPMVFRWALAPAFGALAAVSLLLPRVHLSVIVAAALSALLVGCLFCHGELVRIKPAPRRLTSFYFAMALGGALGGVFVGLVAPLIYSRYSELPVSLIACVLLAFCMAYGGASSAGYVRVTVVAILCVAMFFAVVEKRRGPDILRVRNFYGALRVTESNSDAGRMRTLFHGTTAHGAQLVTSGKELLPTTYYGPASAIGVILGKSAGGARRIGVVGLGAGTLAAYATENDYVRIYEINPLVYGIAMNTFGFLRHCKGRYDVVLGDARISMQYEPNQNFDVLALDAFSGDSVPVHLLTREAIELYFRHLKPDGVLAVHISNRYLDLAPVVVAGCETAGRAVRVFSSGAEPKLGTTDAVWALATANTKILEGHYWRKGGGASARVKPWTDDYSNLLQIIRR